MESNDKLRNKIKNCTCFPFDFNFCNILIDEKYVKLFWFIKFYAKL